MRVTLRRRFNSKEFRLEIENVYEGTTGEGRTMGSAGEERQPMLEPGSYITYVLEEQKQ